MFLTKEKRIHETIEVMKEAYSRNWITNRDGNCAFKINSEKEILITPSGVAKKDIKFSSFVKITYSDNVVNFENPQGFSASGEWEMHYLILKEEEDSACSLHLHPPYIVAAMHAGWNLRRMAIPFPEIYRYTKVGNNVKDLPPISKDLAEETKKMLDISNSKRSYDIVGQKSHGVTAVAKTPWDAFEHIERLEHISRIVLSSGVTPE